MDSETTPLALTNSEFARLARISVSRFYELRQAKLIPDELRAPIPNRWSRAKVERWLAEGAAAIQPQRGRRRAA